MDWLDLLAVHGTLKSLLQHHRSKASILWHSAFFIVQLLHPNTTTGKTIALTRCTFVGKVMSLLFNMLSRLVITFLSRSKPLLISRLQSPSAVILEPKKQSLYMTRSKSLILGAQATMLWVSSGRIEHREGLIYIPGGERGHLGTQNGRQWHGSGGGQTGSVSEHQGQGRTAAWSPGGRPVAKECDMLALWAASQEDCSWRLESTSRGSYHPIGKGRQVDPGTDHSGGDCRDSRSSGQEWRQRHQQWCQKPGSCAQGSTGRR